MTLPYYWPDLTHTFCTLKRKGADVISFNREIRYPNGDPASHYLIQISKDFCKININ